MSKASNNVDKGGGGGDVEGADRSSAKGGGLSSTGSTKKSGRKISLPWFRQSSVPSHAALARQHTIDSPGSFQFFRKVRREVCRSVNQYGRPTSGFLVLVMVVTKGGNGQCMGGFRRILVNHPWHVNVVDRELSNKISHGGKMREERAVVCGTSGSQLRKDCK